MRESHKGWPPREVLPGMFEKEIKTMRVTKSPKKEPFKLFSPRKRKELLHKLADDRYAKDRRVYVAKRLEALVNNHNRVKKLNSGKCEPLLPEEETVFDVEKMLEVSSKVDVTWVAPIPESDEVQTPFDQPPGADYERPGEDCTEEQQKFIAEIRAAEYLVFSKESRKFFRMDLFDSNLRIPLTDITHPKEDLRYCICCVVHIFLPDWLEHITSYYHQLKLKIRTKLLGFCWFENKRVVPHKVDKCQSCAKKSEYLRNTPDLYKWDDFSQYDQATDPEYLQYLDRVKIANTASVAGRFSCIPCGKINLSKEYYEAHLMGRNHKMKMSQIGKESQKGKEPKQGKEHGKEPRKDKEGHEKVGRKRKAPEKSDNRDNSEVEAPELISMNVPSKQKQKN